MKPLADFIVAPVLAVAVYFGACLLWMIGRWAAIVPAPEFRAFDFTSAFVPPLVLPVVFLAWFAVRRKRKPAASWRRFIQFGIAAVIAMGVSAVQFALESGKGANAPFMKLPALVAFGLMALVAVLALAVDHDVELALRFLLITLVSVIPVVVFGRLLTPVVHAFKSVVRTLSGSTS
jgi:hypothetical protein